MHLQTLVISMTLLSVIDSKLQNTSCSYSLSVLLMINTHTTRMADDSMISPSQFQAPLFPTSGSSASRKSLLLLFELTLLPRRGMDVVSLDEMGR